MVLSNVDIVQAIGNGKFSISDLPSPLDPSEKPFNTSAIDLRLGSEIVIPKSDAPVQLDLSQGNIAKFWHDNSDKKTLTRDQPFTLHPNKFVLANTFERVHFPILKDGCYAARVEGKSSLARCGMLVHFTAPTIHSGFEGPITLEIINMGPIKMLLIPGMYICQLIIEEVKSCPAKAPNQFSGQTRPEGNV